MPSPSAFPTPSQRQQVLFLWLEGTALEERVLAWAFYDGTGNATEDLEEDPPYPDGLAALLDGWRLVAAPTPEVRTPGATDFGAWTTSSCTRGSSMQDAGPRR